MRLTDCKVICYLVMCDVVGWRVSSVLHAWSVGGCRTLFGECPEKVTTEKKPDTLPKITVVMNCNPSFYSSVYSLSLSFSHTENQWNKKDKRLFLIAEQSKM